jgi:hypothetical protein
MREEKHALVVRHSIFVCTQISHLEEPGLSLSWVQSDQAAVKNEGAPDYVFMLGWAAPLFESLSMVRFDS